MLCNLAHVYKAMSAYDKALPLFQRALAIDELVLGEDHPTTAMDLNNLAALYESIGAYDNALRLNQRARTILEKTLGSEHPSTGLVLNDTAFVLESMGAYDKALPLYEHALQIAEKTEGPDHPSTSARLGDLANFYRGLGASDKPLPLQRRALSILERAFGPDHPSTGTATNNLALLFDAAGEHDKALPLYERALVISETTLGPDHPATAERLNNLGGMYLAIGAPEKALPLNQRALVIGEKFLGADHPTTGIYLNNLAAAYRDLGLYDSALQQYQRALSIALARMARGTDPALLASVAAGLCRLLDLQGPSRRNEAIFYCKLGINARQSQRSGTRGLEAAVREGFVRHVGDEYARLARLLTQAGRIAEAEQVLIALKSSELTEYARGDQQGNSIPLEWTGTERAEREDLEAIAVPLIQTYTALERDRRGIDLLSEERRTALRDQRMALQRQLLSVLETVHRRLDKPESGTPIANLLLHDSELKRLTEALAINPQGESNVLVSYVLEERVTTVLVFTPAGTLAWQLQVGRRELHPQIEQFRKDMINRSNHRPVANIIYRELVRPVEERLLALGHRAETWMFYLTGRLRYLPFAALVDDNGSHLVESRRLAVYTARAQEQVRQPSTKRWRADAFGSTRGSDSDQLGPLPSVERELKAIVRGASNPDGALPGTSSLDDKFTRDAWRKVLWAAPGNRASVLHVATHFKVRPGSWEQSFLLLGDGRQFRVSELRDDLNVNLEDVELVTLSACATELTYQADGTEVEGLGALLQRKGARSVIGTLWAVQDEGGAAVMEGFYRARGEHRRMSKAAALQAAQLRLLRGETSSVNPAVKLDHPYYWAPFVLMGNWL